MPEYKPYYVVSDFIVGGILQPYASVHTLICRKWFLYLVGFYSFMPEYTPYYVVSDSVVGGISTALLPEYTSYHVVSDFFCRWVSTSLCQSTHPTTS